MLSSGKNVVVIFLVAISSSLFSKCQSASESYVEPHTDEARREENRICENETTYLEQRLDLGYRLNLFGKSSSFLQTAKEFFSGNASLFKGSKIYDRGNADCWFIDERHRDRGKWLKYPIIYLDFENMNNFQTMEQFEDEYKEKIRSISRLYDFRWFTRHVMPDEVIDDVSSLALCLKEEFQLPVVVLIDQYDVPLDYAAATGNEELKEEVVRYLNRLFDGPLRNNEEIRLVFVTVASNKRDFFARKMWNSFLDMRDFVYAVEYYLEGGFL